MLGVCEEYSKQEKELLWVGLRAEPSLTRRAVVSQVDLVAL